MKKNNMSNIFQEDDQASLLEIIRIGNPELWKSFFKGENDGKIKESYRFVILDFSKDEEKKISC